MNLVLTYLIYINRNILLKLIEENAPYQDILDQSIILEKLIMPEMLVINKIRS